MIFFWQHGVFTELCKHESCSCATEPYCGNLRLVSPGLLSDFVLELAASLQRANLIEFVCGLWSVVCDLLRFTNVYGEIMILNFLVLFQVVPISSFIYHCEATWMKKLLELDKNSHILSKNKRYSLLSCEGKSYGRSKMIFSSRDIGIVLLGSVKVSCLISF